MCVNDDRHCKPLRQHGNFVCLQVFHFTESKEDKAASLKDEDKAALTDAEDSEVMTGSNGHDLVDSKKAS